MEQNEAFVIRTITHNDIQSLTRNFARYSKKQEMYERLWREHELGKRVALVAIIGQEAVGYTNLLWQSSYKRFQENDIPEIHNMHVIDEHQQQGIGTALIKAAEHIATHQNKKAIGIGVDIKPK
jgi:predicted N-acetyltransferase YhbS